MNREDFQRQANLLDAARREGFASRQHEFDALKAEMNAHRENAQTLVEANVELKDEVARLKKHWRKNEIPHSASQPAARDTGSDIPLLPSRSCAPIPYHHGDMPGSRGQSCYRDTVFESGDSPA